VTHQDDTQPKPPAGLRDALDETGPHQPTNPIAPTGQFPAQQVPLEPPAESPSIVSYIMLLVVLGMASCLCLMIIGLSGVAGIRDELSELETQSAATQFSGAATQYQLAQNDISGNNYELAIERLSFVLTQVPDYQDAVSQLADAEIIAAYTPTPTVTPTTIPATATLEPTAEQATTDGSPAPTQDPNQLNAEELFNQAQSAMVAAEYEDSIEWLDVLILVDPSYRRDEVRQMLLDAHIAQGRIYLRGQNADGEDRLAQGVQLIFRANELGDVPGDVLYEADFIARYLAARAYVDGGAFAQAREVLVRLCEEDCDWTYRGVSVRDLLAQAGG